MQELNSTKGQREREVFIERWNRRLKLQKYWKEARASTRPLPKNHTMSTRDTANQLDTELDPMGEEDANDIQDKRN